MRAWRIGTVSKKARHAVARGRGGAQGEMRRTACRVLALLLCLTAAPLTAQGAEPAARGDGGAPSLEQGRALYAHYCVQCHGAAGDGNGFNAARLSVKPANHTDRAFMAERSDEKLFDTINLGGAEVAKSTLMPPWGAALADDTKIRSLVLRLRELALR